MAREWMECGGIQTKAVLYPVGHGQEHLTQTRVQIGGGNLELVSNRRWLVRTKVGMVGDARFELATSTV